MPIRWNRPGFAILVWISLLSEFGFATNACADEGVYVRVIRPLLKQRCLSCHGALKSQSGLRLDTVASMLKGGDRGPTIELGKSAESLILDAVNGTNGVAKMPPAGQAETLTVEQIATLKAWIDAGAPHPADEQPEPDPRLHWAFQKPVRPSFPTVKPTTSIKNPIDVFVQNSLEQRGLIPSTPADRATLLRRVALDLTGLPPSRADLQSFLSDDAPDAYERVVDRLLQSPQYGERWARHWMDVWRYSDWYGRRNVPDWWNSASQIWRWRDWIVTSLNSDKGYDRMVMEMLAADEIAPGDDAAAVATGYLARNWYALNYNHWMRENVEHTAKAFLGLTFHCAHCHDHKYDPISQEDYFRFRAFFEPLELRQDRVPGEPDPGPFQKYSYSVLRKVVRTGSLRVFDERLAAPTYFYSGGDERNRVEGRSPITAGLPSALCQELKIEPVKLPADVAYPGLRPFIRQEEIAVRQTALNSAEKVWLEAQAKFPANILNERQQERILIEYELAAVLQADPTETPIAAAREKLKVIQGQIDELEIPLRVAERQYRHAQAELESLQARLLADDAKHLNIGGPADQLATAASLAERKVVCLAAEVELAKAEQKRLEAQQKPPSDMATAAAITAAEQAVVKAQQTVATARTALAVQNTTYTVLGPQYPAISSGRRKALAQWLGSRDNPLTARVAINQIWLRHFGTAIVESVFDFGRNGKTPTHPELLDWLAVEFMESGWSQRHIHRLIVTSATYQQASAVATENPNAKLDPDNRWLWRFPRRRIESEVVHDAFLSVAGELDLKMGGQELENDQEDKARRRTLYFSIYPEDGGRMKFLENFDAPDPGDCYRRTENVIPQQALALTNSPFSRELSRKLARKLWDSSATMTGGTTPRTMLIQSAFEQILTRKPTAAEQERCLAFWELQAPLFQRATAAAGNQAQPAPDPEFKAYESLVHSLFSHHDFVTIK